MVITLERHLCYVVTTLCRCVETTQFEDDEACIVIATFLKILNQITGPKGRRVLCVSNCVLKRWAILNITVQMRKNGESKEPSCTEILPLSRIFVL